MFNLNAAHRIERWRQPQARSEVEEPRVCGGCSGGFWRFSNGGGREGVEFDDVAISRARRLLLLRAASPPPGARLFF